jgi:hypothetical protein
LWSQRSNGNRCNATPLTPHTGRTAQLLALMTKGDDAFNERDFEVLDAARVTGTFNGEMALPDGRVIPPTGKAFGIPRYKPDR